MNRLGLSHTEWLVAMILTSTAIGLLSHFQFSSTNAKGIDERNQTLLALQSARERIASWNYDAITEQAIESMVMYEMISQSDPSAHWKRRFQRSSSRSEENNHHLPGGELSVFVAIVTTTKDHARILGRFRTPYSLGLESDRVARPDSSMGVV